MSSNKLSSSKIFCFLDTINFMISGCFRRKGFVDSWSSSCVWYSSPIFYAVVKSFPWYHRPLDLRSFSWIVDSHHVRFWGAVIVQCEICCVRLMRNWKLWNLVMVFYSFEMYMDEYFNNHLLCVGKMLFSYGWTTWRKKPPARKDGFVCGWIAKKNQFNNHLLVEMVLRVDEFFIIFFPVYYHW